MKKATFAISTLAVVGFAVAHGDHKTHAEKHQGPVHHKKGEFGQGLARCVDTPCGEGYGCNEFKYCIKKGPSSDPVPHKCDAP